MSWIKRQLQKIAKPKKSAIKQTAPKKPPVVTPTKKAVANDNLKKAQSEALKVDKQLHQKGITVSKGKDVTQIEAPPKTKTTGWKPNTNLPPKSTGKSKGKGMSR